MCAAGTDDMLDMAGPEPFPWIRGGFRRSKDRFNGLLGVVCFGGRDGKIMFHGNEVHVPCMLFLFGWDLC